MGPYILVCILFGDRETRRQEGAAYKIRSCTLSCTIFLVCRRGALSAIGGPTGPVGPWEADRLAQHKSTVAAARVGTVGSLLT